MEKFNVNGTTENGEIRIASNGRTPDTILLYRLAYQVGPGIIIPWYRLIKLYIDEHILEFDYEMPLLNIGSRWNGFSHQSSHISRRFSCEKRPTHRDP